MKYLERERERERERWSSHDMVLVRFLYKRLKFSYNSIFKKWLKILWLIPKMKFLEKKKKNLFKCQKWMQIM